MFATGNSTLLPGMAAQPQPGRYEGAGVSPSAATTLTHASLLSSLNVGSPGLNRVYLRYYYTDCMGTANSAYPESA